MFYAALKIYMNPLPKLLMRSIIQITGVWPPLREFVVNRVLSELMTRRKMYQIDVLWKGFLFFFNKYRSSCVPLVALLPKAHVIILLDKVVQKEGGESLFYEIMQYATQTKNTPLLTILNEYKVKR